jgi:non-homologous end joining protein Ku
METSLTPSLPGRSRSLDIQTFVGLDEIDPIYFQKTYYLGPPDKDTAKTYGLLPEPMASTNRAAIASFVIRGREYLAVIRADDDLLVLETRFFADEVRDPHRELDNLPGAVSSRGKELKMAEQLITSMSGKWRPKDYHDTYTERVKDLIDEKGKGEEITVSEEAPQATNVVDLLQQRHGKEEPGEASGQKEVWAKAVWVEEGILTPGRAGCSGLGPIFVCDGVLCSGSEVASGFLGGVEPLWWCEPGDAVDHFDGPVVVFDLIMMGVAE